MKRVVVTGMGAVSPFGKGVAPLWKALTQQECAIQKLPAHMVLEGQRSEVASLVPDLDHGGLPRTVRRSMGKDSLFATLASLEALEDSAFSMDQWAQGRLGVIMGNTMSSSNVTEAFFRDFLPDRSIEVMKSTYFFKVMNHSCSANVARALGVRGRSVGISGACATSCQAVGMGYELIAMGKQDLMLCGGSDEYHPLSTGVFDLMNAASTGFNDNPKQSSRPFDQDRDGVVCAEGAGVLLLEALDHARDRGATIWGEVKGFASVTDAGNMADPSQETIARGMQEALHQADLVPTDINYINAHATGTVLGDLVEGQAIASVFGGEVPVSSLKGHIGHAMAASGSLELIACLKMMEADKLLPTLNLEKPDPSLNTLDLLQAPRELHVQNVVKNNFAMGGLNVSLVLGEYQP